MGVVPVALQYYFTERELRECCKAVADDVTTQEALDVASDLLDLWWQRHGLTLQLFLQVVDEGDLPLQPFDLPRPKCKCEYRDDANQNHRRRNPGLPLHLVSLRCRRSRLRAKSSSDVGRLEAHAKRRPPGRRTEHREHNDRFWAEVRARNERVRVG